MKKEKHLISHNFKVYSPTRSLTKKNSNLLAMVLMPQKFAICFTLGCCFIIGSFFALKGPKNQLAHMFSKERLPFTVIFIGSMLGTLYVSMGLHSYILSVFFSVLQVIFY
ncbi:protein transport protein SFT2-like isoform X1 [Cucumis melo]|uniref:Vesicle transport protein n=1 Tax=Cucumis melo TaxID=3656 RepID=A0ABM3L2M3_CUCME|nr:protein transport protein SFT2-like isoform X1 [Cucumis melo]